MVALVTEEGVTAEITSIQHDSWHSAPHSTVWWCCNSMCYYRVSVLLVPDDSTEQSAVANTKLYFSICIAVVHHVVLTYNLVEVLADHLRDVV
eukprot:9502-Heterococcus_DN1.PRE.3